MTANASAGPCSRSMHAADADAQYVRGVLESGEESFRMRFFGAEAAQ